MRRMLRLLVVAASVGVFAGLVACGSDEKCQVQGENCSQSYKTANNITYGCCAGLSCSSGPVSGVLICR